VRRVDRKAKLKQLGSLQPLCILPSGFDNDGHKTWGPNKCPTMLQIWRFLKSTPLVFHARFYCRGRYGRDYILWPSWYRPFPPTLALSVCTPWTVQTVDTDGVDPFWVVVWVRKLAASLPWWLLLLSRSSDKVSGGVGPVSSKTPSRRLRQKIDITPRWNYNGEQHVVTSLYTGCPQLHGRRLRSPPR